MRVMILGLDGATWDLLLPMIEDGKMKNLKKAMDMGSWGVLKSTLPPISPVAWTSLATGKNPGKHGVLGFTTMEEEREVPVDSASVDSRALWEILSEHGKKVGVVSVPMTYPPRTVNGYIVSGMMTPRDAENYTYPSSLKQDICRAVGEYRADPYVKSGRQTGHLEEIRHWLGREEELCQYLIRRYEWDFFMNVIRAPDLVQHWFYDVLDPGRRDCREEAREGYGTLLESIYEGCDQVIGNRLEMLDGDTILLIASDHGFGPASHWFAVNRFLADIGLLTIRDRGGLRKLVAERVDLTVLARLDALGLRYRLRDSWALAMGHLADRAFSAGDIDWSETRAYCCSAHGLGIRINLVGREPEGLVQPGQEYGQVRDHVRSELERLEDPATGHKVVSSVYLGEEMFSGPHIDETPDVIFSLDEGPFVPRPWLSARRIFEPIWRNGWTGDHREHGIFVAVGGNVRSGARLSVGSILDVTPTVLWSMGLPIPWDMDGVPMEDAFGEGFVQVNPPRFEEPIGGASGDERPGYSRQEEEQVLQRLRGLGYL